jgi:hypothetical protein
MATEADVGIPDLVRQLGDDSKRLLQDEVRLAKLEITESLHRAGRGAVWMGVAFGVGVVMLVALTLFLVTLIGRAVNGHMWVGAIVTGIIELAVAVVLIKRGMSALAEPSYTLEETRESVKSTARWVKAQV